MVSEGGISNSGIQLALARDGARPADQMEIDGRVTAEHTDQFENAIWHHLPDLRPVREGLFGQHQDRRQIGHSHPLALTQLLITYHLLRKYSDIQQIPIAPPVAALTRLRTPPGAPAVDSDAVLTTDE
jgi:phosphoribulokinase